MEGACQILDPMMEEEDPAEGVDATAEASATADPRLDGLSPVKGESGCADKGQTGVDARATGPTRHGEALEHSRAGQETCPTEDIQPMRVVEAVLFASDCPLPPAKIAAILGVGDARDVRKHVASLNEQYEAMGASFRIDEIAGGFQVRTLPVYKTWLARLSRAREETKLSQAALETLAIVAYKQPTTRADIEAIRGVAAGDMLQRLRELNVVKTVGRAEDLGRPLLYGTTKHFLEVFGLASLEDLPQVEALKKPETAPSRPTIVNAATVTDDTAAAPSTGNEGPPQLRIADGD